ncbi:MAG: ECF transporter S component [Clostridia bacterium]|nr:ECF transporter S component [Clostridia bacterium]
MRDRMRKLCAAGVFAAMVMLATMFASLPIGATGAYMNAGEVVVYIASFVLGGWWAVAASGIGAALADILLGVAFYAPATLLIKAAVSLLACWVMRCKFKGSEYVAPFVAGILVPIGYFAYEWLLFGITGALAGVVFNVIQYIGCALIASVSFTGLKRLKRYLHLDG